MAFSPRGFLLGNRSPGNSVSNSPSSSFSHPAHTHNHNNHNNHHHTDEKQHTTLATTEQPPPPRHHQSLDSFSSRPQCLDNHPRYPSAPLAIRKDDDSRAALDSFTSNITGGSKGSDKGKPHSGAHLGAYTNHNIMVAQHRQRQLGLVDSPQRPEPPVFNKFVTAAATPTMSPAVMPSATLLSSSSSTVTSLHRPMTPTSPVRIPASKNQRGEKRYHDAHKNHHHGRGRKTPAQKRPGHNPDAISPSVAALLAITNIPRSRATRVQALAGRATGQSREESMTVDAIIQRVQRNEKEISLTLSKSPMDLLLSSPDDGMDDSDCLSFSDDFDDNASLVSSTPSRVNISARTVSDDSVSSLDESFTSGSALFPVVSPGTPGTPFTNYTPSTFGSSYRRKSPRVPLRRRPEPLSSPLGNAACDPLASPSPTMASVDQLDFRVFGEEQQSGSEDDKKSDSSFRPLKSAFKSNLTASLRALRNAARSISNLGIASIPPEDFLTRSILTIDPRVPFTDERRPPPLEEEPSAALRRYLNPTTTARMELRPAEPDSSTSPTRPNFTASIQMQTYKVRRSRSGSHHGTSPSSPRGIPSPSPQKSTTGEAGPQSPESVPDATSPLALPGRQREMRENSDFIRIAVMEMAMRKRGKLSDQRPGRARWALPPRKTSSKEYEIGPDGVPARWVPVFATS